MVLRVDIVEFFGHGERLLERRIEDDKLGVARDQVRVSVVLQACQSCNPDGLPKLTHIDHRVRNAVPHDVVDYRNHLNRRPTRNH